MFEQLITWIQTFDPLGELYSFIIECFELLSTPRSLAKPKHTRWLLKRFRSLIGLDTWTFYVGEANGWRGAEIEQLLADHGVCIGSRGFAFGDLFFNIKLDQARWAENVMLRAGVPLKYGLYSGKNQQYQRQQYIR